MPHSHRSYCNIATLYYRSREFFGPELWFLESIIPRRELKTESLSFTLTLSLEIKTSTTNGQMA